MFVADVLSTRLSSIGTKRVGWALACCPMGLGTAAINSLYAHLLLWMRFGVKSPSLSDWYQFNVPATA